MIVRAYALEACSIALLDSSINGSKARRMIRRKEPPLAAVGRIRSRGLDRQGRGKRDSRLRSRRKHSDSWRQRVRAGLSSRTPFPRPRVNRIFEGTNEINRLLIPGMLARRAVKGDLALIPAAKALREELLGPPQMQATDDSLLSDERRTIDSLKKTALMVLGLAMETLDSS